MVHSGMRTSYRSVDWTGLWSVFFLKFVTFFALPFSELSLVGLALNLVDL